MSTLRAAAVWLVLGLLAACGSPAASSVPGASPSRSASAGPGGDHVVLMTHDSFAISDELLDSFEAATGLTVDVLRAGDAGAMVNQAILTREAPLADVLFGVDNTFLSRALEAGIFEAYEPVGAEVIPAGLRLDPQNRATPIDYGEVCINFDRETYDPTQAPRTIEDLADPQFAGQLVVENPATSSPGLAFMLATIERFGETGDYTWIDYWNDLRANDVLVVSGWEEAYYSQFSGGAGEGDRPLVVSYATSPAAEVFFADPQPSEAPTGVLEDGCFRQVEFAGILAGARNRDGAEQLLDFMVAPEFQADIPLNMFVFPARSDVELPEVFVQHAVAVDQPLTMDPARIAANRDRWQQEWTDAVLR
jgi:thiamine transport system substrate-binding protein